jgi:hypothetical protein
MDAFGALLLDLCSEVFLGVEDDFVGTGSAGEGGFFFRGNGGEDIGAERFGHLGEEEAYTSGSGVDEDFVAGADRVRRMGEIVGGHALKHGSGGLLKGDGFRDLDEAVGGSYGELRVGSGDTAPGYAVAYFNVGDVIADSNDYTCGLLAEGVGEFGWVAAFPEVDVDKVDAGGFDSDKSFAGTGSWSRQFTKGEHVGASGGENLNGLHFELDADVRDNDFEW